jgi:hypothetical protein
MQAVNRIEAPRMGALTAAAPETGTRSMWLIVLEALAALALLLFVVWWTMFSGRRRGERPPPDDEGR